MVSLKESMPIQALFDAYALSSHTTSSDAIKIRMRQVLESWVEGYIKELERYLKKCQDDERHSTRPCSDTYMTDAHIAFVATFLRNGEEAKT